jgi:hypothetical protein
MCKVALHFSTPADTRSEVITWLQPPTEGLSVEEQVKVIRKTENGKRRKPTCVGIWSHKFYYSNDLEKENENY